MQRENEELKKRLEMDENFWLKVQAQSNRQHADSLNQLADVMRLTRGLIARIDKLERKLKGD